jgi:hypothetical protein
MLIIIAGSIDVSNSNRTCPEQCIGLPPKSEVIDFYSSHKQLVGSLDVLIGNPPFIKWDLMSTEMKERVAGFMKDYSVGKVDMFLPICRQSRSFSARAYKSSRRDRLIAVN